MKKLIMLAVSIVLSCVVLVSCAKNEGSDIVNDSVSEITQDILVGEDESFSVVVSVGQREQSQFLDGKRNTMHKYFNIKIIPKQTYEQSTIEYKLKSGDNIYNGVLPKANSKRGFYQDLKNAFSYTDGITVEINGGEQVISIELVSVLNDGLMNSDEVITTIKQHYAELISSLTVNNQLNCEIVLRLIEDNNTESKNFFWYVAIVDSDKKISSMLIDAKTKEIVA